MAEFALGLTKTAVEGTLIRVKTAIDEDAKLKVQVQNDLVFISGEFQMMQAFLTAANRERANNEVVRAWVTQLRELAFDVEDCIEFVVHLDKPSALDWVRRLASSCICMAPPLPLDVAVNQIQQLKARVEDVSLRNTRYNLISDYSGSSSSPGPGAGLTVEFDSATPSPKIVAVTTTTSSTAFQMLSEVWEAAGKKKSTSTLSDLGRLISGKGCDLEVISLWGSTEAARIEAPHVIRKAYCDWEICREFKTRAWVKLMHPYKPDEFLESLLTQLYASSRLQATNNQAGDDDGDHLDFWGTREDHRLVKAELARQVKEHRYLIVVEGVSSVAEWDAIKMYLPDSKKGSRVIVYTDQLGSALSCTGEPYRVSELGRFSDDQSLCAFLTKPFAQRLCVGELIWQISLRGVISVWGGKSVLLHQVFDCIALKCKELDGVEFQRHCWVDVPDPFDLIVFSRRLLVNFYSDDFQAEEIAAVGITGAIERCCRFLLEDDCLVVINGLESTDDWDLIKATFLSEPIKGCILVIVHEASVATHCADHDTRLFNIKDVEDDVALSRLIEGCEYSGFLDKHASHRGRLLSNRRTDVLNWFENFEYAGYDPNMDINRVTSHLLDSLKIPGVISLWGTKSIDKSVAVRLHYSMLMTNLERHHFKKFSWVDVPSPFNLTEFCWRLLLDFHSDDLEAKEIASISMMKGEDPIQECYKFLHEHKCLVVIDDLRSTDHWDMITHACLPEPINSSIIVITNEEKVAWNCVHGSIEAFKVNYREADMIHTLFHKKGMKGYDTIYGTTKRREFPVEESVVEAYELLYDYEFIRNVREFGQLNGYVTRPCVICISGMAGVGKTAIVRTVYNLQMHVARPDEFTQRRGGSSGYSWVDVPHPFNLIVFCSRLLLDFYSDDLASMESKAVNMMDIQDPVQECLDFLRNRRCFLVVDGLQTTDEWDMIKAALLPEHTKATIFIITNESSVAAHVSHDYRVVTIKCVNAFEALNLFTQKLRHGEQLGPAELEVSQRFIAKCGGIPKVIDATSKFVAEICRRKDKRALELFSDNFVHYLQTLPQFQCLKGIFSWMRSYFDACSDSVKPCIFYLSVFPVEHNIRQRRLLRRWVAEGYSRDTSECINAEQTGKKLLSELITLSIIQEQQSYGARGTSMYQVNGFFREYIISQPMQDNRVFALEKHCSLNTQRAGQHLTIMRSWDRDKIVFESIDFTRVRSLTVFGEWRSFFIPTSDSNNMSLLRVLDLEDTSCVTDDDIKQIGNQLPRLKFLSLRGCIKITCLPSSVGDMRQLQTLDIKNTSIASLPPFISKLLKLQYVSAGTTATVTPDVVSDSNSTTDPSIVGASTDGGDGSTVVEGGDDEAQTTSTALATRRGRSRTSSRACDLVVRCSGWLPKKLRRRQQLVKGGGGVEVPSAGIGKLTALQTLGVVNVGAVGGKAFLKELTALTQLRKLRVSGVNRENWHDLCVAISCQPHLETLSVRFHEEKQHLFCLDDISEPPKKLERLKLYGGNTHVSVVWMNELHFLRNSRLRDLELTISTQEDIDNLFNLQSRNSYRNLSVKPSEDSKLDFSFTSDRNCAIWITTNQMLKINCGSYVLKIVFGFFVFSAKVLVVHCSTTEASLEVSGLDMLHDLKEVRLEGFYSDAVKQHLQQKIDELSSDRRVVLKLMDSSTC